MPADQRAQLRAVFKRVHPDLFAASPDARAVNAESLKVLNAYCDELASGRVAPEARLTFFVRDGAAAVPSAAVAAPSAADADDCSTEALRRVEAVLPARGSLAPLLHAFGLLSDAELQRDEQAARQAAGRGQQDTGLLTWLHEMVAEAVRASEEAEATAAAVAAHRNAIRHTYQLADLQAGTALTAGAAEQQHWLHALDMLEAALSLLTDGQPDRFAGLSIRLAQPSLEGGDEPRGWCVAADSRDEALSQQTHVTSSGILHIVADERHLLDAIDSLDLQRARLLTRLSDFWNQQARSLVPPARELLGVAAVWHDSNADLASQRFVLWASRLLEAKDAVAAYDAALDAVVEDSSAEADGHGGAADTGSSASSNNGSGGGGILGGSSHSGGDNAASHSGNGSTAPGSRKQRQRLPVSVLVHCEMDGPPVEMLASRRLLQVRHDCPPETLLAVLTAAVKGDTFAAGGLHAQAQSAEAALLEAARAALGARRLVRVCTHCTPDDVLQAARRLIDNAADIRSAVDLTGASIAIDDRFEVWDSGYISVPFDFKVEDLQNTLRRKLLGGGGGGRSQFAPAAAAAAGGSGGLTHSPAAVAATTACGTVSGAALLGSSSSGFWRSSAAARQRRKQFSPRPAFVLVRQQPRHAPVQHSHGSSAAIGSIVVRPRLLALPQRLPSCGIL